MRIDPETGLKQCSACKKNKPAKSFWKCNRKCDGLQIQCIECKKKWRDNNYIRYLILACKNRARKEGFSCTIVESDVRIPANCPLCRCLLVKNNGGAKSSSPSLDKYDPTLGYVPGNIWIICQGCNRDKQNMSGEQHVAFGIALIDAFKEYREKELG